MMAQFLIQHADVIVTIVLLINSEILAQNKSIESNSNYQLIKALVNAIALKLKK